MRKKDFEKHYCNICVPIRNTEYKNDIKRDLKIVASGLIIIMLLLIIVYTSPSILYFDGDSIIKNKSDFLQDNLVYKPIVSDFKDDEVVNSIAFLCSNFNNTDDKVYCVHDIATIRFEYSDDLSDHTIYTPSETMFVGGVCRDWSVLFSAIYETMGFDTEFVHEPQHVYIEMKDDQIQRLGIAVGDVSEHGIPSALLMTTARAFIRL